MRRRILIMDIKKQRFLSDGFIEDCLDSLLIGFEQGNQNACISVKISDVKKAIEDAEGRCAESKSVQSFMLVSCDLCYYADSEAGGGCLVCDHIDSPHYGTEVESCKVICRFFKLDETAI